MAKSEATVEELVSMIERGQICLPEMQRQYVWRSTRVRDLIDSLYRGYPSGVILLWETDGVVPMRNFAIGQTRSAIGSPCLLLDGQQRLTSLSAILRGKPVTVRGKVRPVDLLFNLDHPDELAFVSDVEEDNGDADEEEGDDARAGDEQDSSEQEILDRLNQMTFVVSNKVLAQLPNWVSVSEIFKAASDVKILKSAGVSNFDDPRYSKYTERLAKVRAIKNYQYRMDILERSLSYEEVTEIFVRVNSMGAKLRSSDLALAQITARWSNSLKTFLEFQKACAAKGFDLDLGLYLKVMVAFATGQSRFQTVGSLAETVLKDSWDKATKGVEYAINFLKSNLGIDSPALLSSTYLIVVIAYFGHAKGYKLSKDDVRNLRYWCLVANAKGRFSRGSSETVLDQDLSMIASGKSMAPLIERLRIQFGHLDIRPEELEGKEQRSALFKTMFLAFRHAQATDWHSGLKISVDHSGAQHKLQFHHIFPKALLKGRYKPRQVNDIANLAFIGGKTNRTIQSSAPDQYIPALQEKIGNAPFEAQAIPTQHELLSLDSYEKFLAARRQEIAQALNDFIEA